MTSMAMDSPAQQMPGEQPTSLSGAVHFIRPNDGIYLSEGPDLRTIAISNHIPPAMVRDVNAWRVEDFELHKELYRGKTSLLYMATDKRSGTQVALKLYRKKKLSTLNRYQVEREIRLHINLSHENIIKLHAAFEDEKHVYMVQEFATCGDLFEDLKKGGGQLKEKYAIRDVLIPFLSALGYLHQQGIIHRDIKPENILLGAGKIVKIADFGLSINIHHERPVTRAGTLDYMAPEVLVCPDKRRPEENKEKVLLAYTAQVDSWAVGILAYELLVGYPPFEQESRAATYEHIMYKEPKFPAWMSEEAKKFINLALCKNATQRPTVYDLFKHSWLQPYMQPHRNPNMTVQPSRLRNSISSLNDDHSTVGPAAAAKVSVTMPGTPSSGYGGANSPKCAPSVGTPHSGSSPMHAAPSRPPVAPQPVAPTVPAMSPASHHALHVSASMRQPAATVLESPITGVSVQQSARPYDSLSDPTVRTVGSDLQPLPSQHGLGAAFGHAGASQEHAVAAHQAQLRQHHHQQQQEQQCHSHTPGSPSAGIMSSGGSFSSKMRPAPPPLNVADPAGASDMVIDYAATPSGVISPSARPAAQQAAQPAHGQGLRATPVSPQPVVQGQRTRMGPSPSVSSVNALSPGLGLPPGPPPVRTVGATPGQPQSPKGMAQDTSPPGYHRPQSGVLSDDSLLPPARTASVSAGGGAGSGMLSPLGMQAGRPSLSRLNSPSHSRRTSLSQGTPYASTPMQASTDPYGDAASASDSDAGMPNRTSAKYSKLFSKMWGQREPQQTGGDWLSMDGPASSAGSFSTRSAGSLSQGGGGSRSRLLTPPGIAASGDLRPLMRESSMSTGSTPRAGLRDELTQGSMTVYMRPGKTPGVGRAAVAARQQEAADDAAAASGHGMMHLVNKTKSLVHRALGTPDDMVGRTGSDAVLAGRGSTGQTVAASPPMQAQRSFTTANSPFARKLANGAIATKVTEYVVAAKGRQPHEDPYAQDL